jgi:uncharacterized membrane protein
MGEDGQDAGVDAAGSGSGNVPSEPTPEPTPPPALAAKAKPSDWPEGRAELVSSSVRTFTVVTLGMASLALGLGQLAFPRGPEAFLARNAASLVQRLVLLGSAWLLGVAVAAGLLALAARSPNAEAARRSAREFFAPLTLTAFLPILFVRAAWDGREIAYLGYALVLGISLERLLRPAIVQVASAPSVQRLGTWLETAKAKTSIRWGCRLLLGAAVAYYFFRIGHLSNVSHRKFATASSDLAEYDNLFFNALHGHPFRSPAVAAYMDDWSNLQNHAELCLYILLPFYAISPGAHALLWIQSGLVAATAIPVYLLGAARLGRVAGLFLAVVFLCMPAVQQPNFFDFHFTCAAMFFVAWLIYCLDVLARRPEARWARVGMFVSLLSALTCREDIGIGIVVLGIFLIFSGKLVREGISVALLGGVYFVTMKFGIMPLFGTWWFDNMYEDLKSEGAGGFGSIVLTLLSNQAFVIKTLMTEPKVLYLLHMTAPVLGLWLRRPLLLMAVLPGFVATLLVTNRPPLFQSSFQYTYLWVAYVLGASILAIVPRIKWATLVPLVIVALSMDVQRGLLLGGERIMGGFGMKSFDITEADEKRSEQFREIAKLIPKDASLSVTEAEGPHLSARLVMFSLKYSLGHDPEYLLIANPGIRGEVVHIKQALESGKYGVIASKGPYTLVKRGAPTTKNGALLRRVNGRARH